MEEQKQDQQMPSGGMGGESKDVQENKLWALLSYFGVLVLIPLLAKRDSKFVQFHAKQGLILFIGEFFIWIPVFGWILGIIILVLWIMGIISVLSGNMKPLPIVGELAAKINI
ncbi:MAG TPA: hypothetical protein DD454_05320 [Candidatus Moranbacteria bacterium]|nr:hypothetical protein [Candidatus Moranbacteria bacterium]